MADADPITIARFWSKVAVRGASQCWLWRGAKDSGGYGSFKLFGKPYIASRFAWELVNGEELGDRLGCHHCDTPPCCNPAHIYPGTHRSNFDDARDRGQWSPFEGLAGTANPRAILSEADVASVRVAIAAGDTNKAIAARYGVHHATISCIRRGRSWIGRAGFEPTT